VIEEFAAVTKAAGFGISHVGVPAESALEEPFEEKDPLVLEASRSKVPVLLDALLDAAEGGFFDDGGDGDLDPFAARAFGDGEFRGLLAGKLRRWTRTASTPGAVVEGGSDVPLAA
jgi:hypothetical protein